jgi:hypothetical protein
MKTFVTIAALFTTVAFGWSEPQQSQGAPAAQQTTVQTVHKDAQPTPKMVQAPAPKPDKKPLEIQFRDFLTARDAYPTR